MMVVVLVLVVTAPLLLERCLTAQPAGRVGVFERIVLTGDGPRGAVTAGYVVPMNWYWLERVGSGEYLAADGEATIAVEMRATESHPELLRRTGLPAGAALLPTASLPAASDLQATAIEYDLAAGDSPAASITVCTPGRPGSCLWIRVAYSPDDEASRDQVQHDVAALVRSVEIIP